MGKKIFYALALCSFAILGISLASATPASAVDCIGSAKSAFGDDYVNTYITAFNTRCDVNAGQGISDGPYTYGFAAPVGTSFQHTTALNGGSFSFDFQRIIYSGRCETNSKGKCYAGSDEWGSYSSKTSNVTFSGDKISCYTDGSGKSKWYGCEGLTATVNNAAITSVDGDPIEQNFPFSSCYHGSNCKDNTMYYKVYKGTEVHHDTPKGSYGSTTFTDGSTSESSPIVVEGGSLVFSHYLSRKDGWSSPTTASLSSVFKRSFTIGGTATSTGADSSWQSVSLSKPNGTNQTVTHSINISDLNLSPNTPKQVCSTLTHRNYKSLGGHSWSLDSSDNTSDSTICVWVKDDRIFLEPGSRSYVHNSIEDKTVTHTDGSGTLSSMGGSRAVTKKFTFSFTHQLKLEGLSGYSYSIEYYIERSTNGGSSYSTVVSNTTRSVNSGNNGYVSVATNSWVSDDISRGGSTPTVCERITFRPKNIEVKMSTGNTTVKDNSWQSSTVCTKVERRKPKEPEISGTCKVIVDGTENPTDVIYNTHENFQFQFGFNLATSMSYTLPTTYTINRSINNGTATSVRSTAVNAAVNGITDSPLVSVEEGTSKKVCETINVNPYKFTVHLNDNGTDDGSPEAQTGGKDVATCCATVARPKREPRDDGEITVFSESSGALNNTNQTGGYDTDHSAWLMKTQQADITYTHKLWRKAEKHTGDGTHQASVTSPAEDVTVRYRFADPATTFAATSISTTHTSVIATNTESSKYSFNSVSAAASPTDPLRNANTIATAGSVGQLYEYCQSVSYVSEKYTLRGIYWQVDGEIYSGDPSLQGTEAPVSKELVGKSAKGCVNVIRPYNFNVSSITAKGDTKPANAGQDIEATFTVKVDKNNSSYMITDVPNATVKLVNFVLNDKPANLVGAANTSSSPCTYFSDKLGGVMDSGSCSDTATTSLPDHNGSNFYTDNNYTIRVKYPSTIPNLPTNKKYCLAIAVSPTSSNANGSYGFADTLNTNYTISDATCYNIGKYPTLQVWGGSVYTRGGTDTSITTVGSTVFGSWDDYLIIAKDKVNNTASGAALISGTTTFNNCNISPLTVANSTVCPNIDGEPGHSNIERVERVMSGIKSRYIDGTGEYATLSELEGGSYLINRQVLNSALSYYPILLYNADAANSAKPVYIKQDIDIGFNTRAFKNFVIPQVIIYTPGDIYIDPGVSHIDAWLLAGGKIYTCANASGTNIRLTSESDKCGGRLTVTGPVIAEEVHFDRIYGGDAYDDGSGSTIKEPAEIFDLNPGAYLFGANEATDDAQPITTYIHKLPPRY